ncbi:unnamed protein product [Leptidea sinapis]|uniref:Uncharacterized protein n=1 Tax=Leptidea sinapis TaxID=189913 RepID=A0A5E4PXB5_9NEOP|nr:unnamed protein product [Leptidea sinapis]
MAIIIAKKPLACALTLSNEPPGCHEIEVGVFYDNEPTAHDAGWMAPVSLAIHAPGADLTPTVNSIRYLRDCLSNELVKQYVTFHLFFSHKHIPSKIPDPESLLQTPYNCTGRPPYENVTTTYMKEKNLLYPVNVARNIARDAAVTYFILPSDIELYPSPNLIPRFLNMIARNSKPLSTSKNPRVFPISIFEVDAKVQVPSTKTELRAMLANKTAIPFHKFVCPNCHNIPQGQQWMNAVETNRIKHYVKNAKRDAIAGRQSTFVKNVIMPELKKLFGTRNGCAL